MIHNIKGTKLALLYNVGGDFLHNRIHYAHYLQNMGYDVTAILPNDGYAEQIEAQGIRVVTYEFKRNSINPLGLLNVYKFLIKHFREQKYHILHTFRSQPNILGAIAAKHSGIKTVVCHVTGLGIVFSNSDIKSKLLRLINISLYQWAFSKVKAVVVQNPDDYNDLEIALPSIKNKLKLIKGSGINPALFNPNAIDKKEKQDLRDELGIKDTDFVITFVSRMLWHKGVREIVEAAEILHDAKSKLKFLMVGYMDENNPYSINESFLKKYDGKFGLYFLGGRNDVRNILSISSLYIFPSYYREGVPRSVLEAMAMKLPIITTNSPGCNLTVDDDVNGKLVPVKDGNSLAEAIQFFIQDDSKAKSFGIKSREKLKAEFAEDIVFKEFEGLYHI